MLTVARFWNVQLHLSKLPNAFFWNFIEFNRCQFHMVELNFRSIQLTASVINLFQVLQYIQCGKSVGIYAACLLSVLERRCIIYYLSPTCKCWWTSKGQVYCNDCTASSRKMKNMNMFCCGLDHLVTEITRYLFIVALLSLEFSFYGLLFNISYGIRRVCALHVINVFNHCLHCHKSNLCIH